MKKLCTKIKNCIQKCKRWKRADTISALAFIISCFSLYNSCEQNNISEKELKHNINSDSIATVIAEKANEMAKKHLTMIV